MRKGFSFLKMIVALIVMTVLVGMVGFVYFGWQKGDLSKVEGSEDILSGKPLKSQGDVRRKLRNAINGKYEVVLTEEELNYYIAKNLKMSQGGFMKGFAKVKGVFVDLKPGLMEVIILREIAQYNDDGSANTEYIQPFEQTVSMKLKIVTVDTDDGGSSIVVDFPGGTVGKAPAPGQFVKVVKSSFDQILEHFSEEVELGYKKMVRVKVEEGKISFDPRRTVKKVQR